MARLQTPRNLRSSVPPFHRQTASREHGDQVIATVALWLG